MSSEAGATILVLEESAAVQDLIEQALRDCGHRVLSTENALEALEVVRKVCVDVVVVSALLESGRQTLIHELGSIQPGLQVVSISGSDGDDLQNPDRVASLSSPFSLDDLLQAVSLELERRNI